MHRRVFLWFAGTILVSFLLAGLSMRLTFGEPGWKRDYDHARAFVGARFAEVWRDDAARDRLAHATVDELDVHVTLRDDKGAVLEELGDRCRHPLVVPVKDSDGRDVGVVELCSAHDAGHTGLRIALPLLVGLLTMWAASGAIARRLSRPIHQLAHVAEEIGRGNLATRVHVGRHHHGEVRVLAASLNDMASRIERQLADQRALLATVSHEIRTPLARMRLLVELVRGGDAAALAKLEAEVDDIDRLVGDLLASSRLDFSAMNRTRLDATSVAQEAIERAEVDPSLLVVDDPRLAFEGDATLVSRAVANLVENAKRHGGGLATLRVRASADGTGVVFEAEDGGSGFLPGEETKIFEPFYRRGEREGSVGLGLALVKRIAEAHGGRAWAENRAGGGARVAIALPLARDDRLST